LLLDTVTNIYCSGRAKSILTPGRHTYDLKASTVTDSDPV